MQGSLGRDVFQGLGKVSQGVWMQGSLGGGVF